MMYEVLDFEKNSVNANLALYKMLYRAYAKNRISVDVMQSILRPLSDAKTACDFSIISHIWETNLVLLVQVLLKAERKDHASFINRSLSRAIVQRNDELLQQHAAKVVGLLRCHGIDVSDSSQRTD